VIVEEAKRHDLALVLEPGRPGPDLTVERKGVAIFHLDVEGREAHAGAEPGKGLNSIVELAHKTLAIQALNDAGAGTTVTPGVVNGGTKPYVVPGRARLSVDCRVVSMQEQARVTAGIEEAAKRSWIEGTRATLSGGFHRPPMQASELTMRYVARFQEAARAVGYPLGAGSTGGASDGNLTAAAGTATIDGLGVHGARAHSREEYAEVPSLVAKCRALAAFLKSLGERPGVE
jgi:glutamate carboxypeptidase